MTDADYQAALDQCHVNRRDNYPTIGDQLDAIYKRDALGVLAPWADICDQIAAVKANYPKPVKPAESEG